MNRFDLACALAKQGGEICLKWFGGKNVVTKKSDTDIVLTADLEAEKFILGEIRKLFPDDAILSEEAGETGKQSSVRWIVDPLDGPVNFNAGIPFFCCAVGVEEKGKMVAAAVYDPITQELYTAERGNGAFLNGNEIHVSPNKNLRASLISSMSRFKDEKAQEQGMRDFQNVLRHCRSIRIRGCTMIDLCQVGRGVFDGFIKIYGAYEDCAVGTLIVEEAGGHISDYDNNPWGPNSKNIVASNGAVHTALLKALGG
jgi:myo-inositol-1(or 4)-monophosphatase